MYSGALVAWPTNTTCSFSIIFPHRRLRIAQVRGRLVRDIAMIVTNRRADIMPSVEGEPGQGVDPNQMVNTYVHPPMTESNYIVGSEHGVRISSDSRLLFI